MALAGSQARSLSARVVAENPGHGQAVTATAGKPGPELGGDGDG
jgi:hypothetical protein